MSARRVIASRRIPFALLRACGAAKQSLRRRRRLLTCTALTRSADRRRPRRLEHFCATHHAARSGVVFDTRTTKDRRNEWPVNCQYIGAYGNAPYV